MQKMDGNTFSVVSRHARAAISEPGKRKWKKNIALPLTMLWIGSSFCLRSLFHFLSKCIKAYNIQGENNEMPSSANLGWRWEWDRNSVTKEGMLMPEMIQTFKQRAFEFEFQAYFKELMPTENYICWCYVNCWLYWKLLFLFPHQDDYMQNLDISP